MAMRICVASLPQVQSTRLVAGLTVSQKKAKSTYNLSYASRMTGSFKGSL